MNELVLLLLVVVGLVMFFVVFFDLDNKFHKKEENTIGKLIVIEGIEGSGKSTLIQLLKENMPIEWAYTKEPYYIVDGIENWTKENYQMDRETHVQNKIIPMLQQNRVLITNRYWMSGCVYDGWEAESYLHTWPEPDLIIWLDSEPSEETAEFTRVPIEILQAMREGYAKLFEKMNRVASHIPIKKIDTTQLNEEEMLKSVAAELGKLVKLHETEGESAPQYNSQNSLEQGLKNS
jgi:thymidylate kinase